MASIRVIGPGRAGGSLATALGERGWAVADSVARGAAVTAAASGVDFLVIATPDSAVAEVAAAVEPVDTTVVMHLSGALGLSVLAPHRRRASLHPLMSLPNPTVGAVRLLSSISFAIDGDAAVGDIVNALGGHAFSVRPADRHRYHAAASIASNHVVAAMAQVERLAASIGVPLDAYLDLASASIDNIRTAGSAVEALTGPAARNDTSTLGDHAKALPAEERALYAALSAEAGRLAGHDHTEFWTRAEQR